MNPDKGGRAKLLLISTGIPTEYSGWLVNTCTSTSLDVHALAGAREDHYAWIIFFAPGLVTRTV